MSIILKHVLKNIWEKKGRSLIIIISLIVTAMITTLCLSVNDELEGIILQTFKGVMGNTDITVTSKSEDKDAKNINLDKINISNDVNKLYEVSDVTAIKYKDDFKYVLLNGFDINKAIEFKLLKDENVKDLQDDEIIITENAAEELDVNINDKITVLDENGNEYDLLIKYIVKKEGVFSIEATNIMLVTNLNTARKLLKIDNNEVSTIYIASNKIKNTEEIKKEIESNNDNLDVICISDMDSLKEALDAITAIFALIFLCVFIMVFFVVNALSKIIINERISVIGTFRSIGATKKKMNFILILENVVYGLIGGAIGAIIGSLIKGNLFLNFVSSTGSIEIIENKDINLYNILLTIIITVCLQIFMSIFAIIKNSKKPIKDLIFNTQNSKYKFSKVKIIIGIILLILTCVLYLKNSRINIVISFIEIVCFTVGIAFVTPVILKFASMLFKKIGEKLNMPVFSLAGNNISNSKIIVNNCELLIISILLMLSVHMASNSLLALFDNISNIFPADILIQYASNDISEYEHIKNFDDVDNIYPFYFQGGNMKINDKEASNLMIVPNNDSDIIFDFFDGIKMNKDKFKNLKENEIILDEEVLKRYGVKIGDTIKITFKSNDEKNILEKTLKIIDDCDSTLLNTSRQNGIISFDLFKEIYPTIPSMICVNVKAGSDVYKVIDELKNKIKDFGLEIQTQEEYTNAQKDRNNGIMGVIGILIGMGIILSFIGIINNQIIGFMQRKREYAVLYSTSMSKKQIRRMITLETILSFGIMGICAVGLSFLFRVIMEQLVHSMYLSVPIVLDIKATLLLILGIYIVMILTTISPRRRLNKMNVINEIKYE